MCMRMAGRLVLVLVLGSLLACNGGEGESSDVGVDGPIKPDAGAATTVGPAGGTFSFFGGKLELKVPPGALTKDTLIKAQIPKSYPQATLLVPGTLYDLLPDGTSFNKAVKLSITYDQGDVPKGSAEAGLRIHKVTGGSWALLPGGGADSNYKVVWTKINGFSKYGIKGTSSTKVDGMTDTGLDAAVPVDATKPDAPDVAVPVDATKPDVTADLKTQCSGQTKGLSCHDPYTCTKGDAWDGKGGCVGTSYLCQPSGQCELSSSCNGKGGCTIVYKTKGVTCDDKKSCTKGDACDGKGACAGTSYLCNPSGQCEISSSCDGKGGCSVTNKSKGVTCDDKNSCTKGDACDGKGGCAGTAYICSASSCETSTCDGKGGCLTKLKSNYCLIGGSCYKSGALHPGGCAECDPTKSTTSWTIKGSAHCLISNVCKKSGDKDSSGCMICDPSKSKTSWTSSGGCQPTHAWSKGFGGSASEAPFGVAVDGNGNVYIAGLLEGNINFGGSTLGKAGEVEVFLASFTPGGKHRWSKSFGGLSKDVAYDVAVDSNGNVYITGSFFSSINFGGSKLNSKGKNDIFVASFDSNGKYRWSKRFGGTSNESGRGVSADSAGNVYVTGSFSNTINFGGSNLPCKGIYDAFMVSFTSSGSHRWSKSFGTTYHEQGLGVAVDGSGNNYITGTFAGSIQFGGATITSKGGYDVYLASFTSSGSHRWSKNFGGTSSDYGGEIAVDSNANVFITGEFNNSADFGGGTLSSNGFQDIYIASYTSSGSHRWSKGFGSSNYDEGRGIGTDNLGNVYVTGGFQNSANFGGGTLTSKGKWDMFVMSFSSVGTHRWSRSFGSTSSDYGQAIVTDSSGNIYMAGSFYKTVDFGGGPISSAGKGDIVLLKLSP